MKALELTQNKTFRIADKAAGPLPLGHCRVSVKFAGICSSDIPRSMNSEAYRYPLTLGHEFSGTIIEIAQDVKNFKLHDRVGAFPLLPCFKCEMCQQKKFALCRNYSYLGSRIDGAFAETVDVPEWNLILIPQDVELIHAAMLEPASVVFNAIRKSGLLEASPAFPGNVVVLGGGFLGLLLCAILKLLRPRCEITVVDRNFFKLEKAELTSNKQVLCKSAKDLERFSDQSEGQYDFVFETTGSPEHFINSIKLAKPQGHLVWIGNIQNDLTLPKKLVSTLLRKELNIKGIWNSVFNPAETTDDWRQILDLFQQGFNPTSFITQIISMEQIPEAIKKMHDHKSGISHFPVLKIMVKNDW